MIGRQLQDRKAWVDGGCLDSEPTALNSLALLELRQNLLGSVDRNRKANANVAVAPIGSLDLTVDSDHLTT